MDISNPVIISLTRNQSDWKERTAKGRESPM